MDYGDDGNRFNDHGARESVSDDDDRVSSKTVDKGVR